MSEHRAFVSPGGEVEPWCAVDGQLWPCETQRVSALARNLLRLVYGLPPDPDDADELGRIFDATPFYGLDNDETPPASQ